MYMTTYLIQFTRQGETQGLFQSIGFALLRKITSARPTASKHEGPRSACANTKRFKALSFQKPHLLGPSGCTSHCQPPGSFPKRGNPNIDPNILESLLWRSQKKVPPILGNFKPLYPQFPFHFPFDSPLLGIIYPNFGKPQSLFGEKPLLAKILPSCWAKGWACSFKQLIDVLLPAEEHRSGLGKDMGSSQK